MLLQSGLNIAGPTGSTDSAPNPAAAPESAAPESSPAARPPPAGVHSLSTADLELALERAEAAVGVPRRLEEGMSTGNALHYAAKSSRRCGCPGLFQGKGYLWQGFATGVP